MPLGITPARGNWETVRSPVTTLSQGQWQKGDLVAIGPARFASLYTSSNYSSMFGVGLHDSLNSFAGPNYNYALVAVPIPGCTAYVDTLSTEARSNLSFGEAGSIVSAGGRTSTFSKLATSVWSRVVEVRSFDGSSSADSRLEVAFIQNAYTLYSNSSVSLLV